MLALGLLAALAPACSSGGTDASPPGTTTATSVVPAVYHGPQGESAQFVVKCAFSHAATDDPIVHPGHHDMSHLHDFFGNQTTDASSTAATLVGAQTTCNQRLDTAAYWSPSLFDHGQKVTPLGVTVYYRPAPGIDPTTLVPYPSGLMMVAGNSKAETAQAPEIAGWVCGSRTDASSTPPTCDPASPLRMRITFPDCWDGTHLDSDTHVAHITYSQAGACPPSHPVAMPQLTLSIRYPISGGNHDLTLTSGSTLTAHADFLNAWNEQELTNQVNLCLHRGVVCSVASNRAEDEPLQTPSRSD